ncbi:plasmodesmata-located protein 1 [Euphorbia lathyris]|uniref:plasmodesmata-located protein 1 n=1 Tax=Euphorbia lathyris TaxID=212925 RepID=UPI0033131BAD
MGLSVFFLLFITIYVLFVSVLPIRAADYSNLVFKGCAKQKFQDPSGIYNQNLKNLFQSLVSQSSTKAYSATSSGDGQTAISGLFQCRGDLTNPQCYTCVSKIPNLVNRLCGEVIAVRIQLSGCYLSYEVAGFKEVSETELLYKVCGSVKASGSGFEEMRTSGFDAMLGGVKNGFYTGKYQTLFILGQCESDLTSGDCNTCLKSGVDSVKNECGDSISGQVYLQKCFISYNYYPNGVPTIGSASEVVGTKHHTEKTIAIAVGGVAAFGFLVACLMFLKSVLKKPKNKYETWN